MMLCFFCMHIIIGIICKKRLRSKLRRGPVLLAVWVTVFEVVFGVNTPLMPPTHGSSCVCVCAYEMIVRDIRDDDGGVDYDNVMCVWGDMAPLSFSMLNGSWLEHAHTFDQHVETRFHEHARHEGADGYDHRDEDVQHQRRSRSLVSRHVIHPLSPQKV